MLIGQEKTENCIDTYIRGLYQQYSHNNNVTIEEMNLLQNYDEKETLNWNEV